MVIGLAAFFLTIIFIGGGFWLLTFNVNVPELAYLGAISGVTSIVALVSAFSSRLRAMSK
jgi:hypothetical protein